VNMPPRDQHPDDGRFPTARKGYDRDAVDHFVHSTHAQIAHLLQQYDTLMANNHELRRALEEANARAAHADFSGLGGRVRELLQIAEEQATDITQQAVQEADRLSAQVHAEVNELRQNAAAELAQMRDAQLAELDGLRQHNERDAADLRERAMADAEQLLSSARLQAEAVRTEAEAAATGMRKAATYESQQLLAGAERDSAAVRQEVADQRERVLAELKQAQESANQTIQAMLAEATELQRAAGVHLTEETERAARVRTDTLGDAERIKVDATADAEQIIDRARHQAAAIDNRARQELALRRRQMRDEQDLLNRRKHAMLNQLTSLSALAVETAENLPDVPDVEFGDLSFRSDGEGGADAEMESDPTLGNAGDAAKDQPDPDTMGEASESQTVDEAQVPRAENEGDDASVADGESPADDLTNAPSGDGDTSKQSPSDEQYLQASKPSAA
jgi:cell division septum initiation protein DivIVA